MRYIDNCRWHEIYKKLNYSEEYIRGKMQETALDKMSQWLFPEMYVVSSEVWYKQCTKKIQNMYKECTARLQMMCYDGSVEKQQERREKNRIQTASFLLASFRKAPQCCFSGAFLFMMSIFWGAHNCAALFLTPKGGEQTYGAVSFPKTGGKEWWVD